ncbi:hypothetical protein D9V86_04805 [Bacteroidetes/Chlorobi group bacterium ChocPot_Mid]|nr:MAG: hypothetical protein D9V86_04805 [Bacteroidetes/Chlorobi group bacterium ChocPot_Mid]
MKILAYILIAIGFLFTMAMLFIIFRVPGWSDLIIGWIFLGPLPLIIGIILLKKINSSPILNHFHSKKK